MSIALPLIAGSMSTVIFVASYLPMLRKALKTKDLASYSPTNLLLTNLGNVVHSFYVFSLPAGPIWFLHSFYLATSGLMTIWYFAYTHIRATTRNSPASAQSSFRANHFPRRTAVRLAP